MANPDPNHNRTLTLAPTPSPSPTPSLQLAHETFRGGAPLSERLRLLLTKARGVGVRG